LVIGTEHSESASVELFKELGVREAVRAIDEELTSDPTMVPTSWS
jgi:hypothetical protein